MGGPSQGRLSRPIGSRSSIETTNLKDHQGLFRPLDEPKMQGFDKISDSPQILPKNAFVGSNVKYQDTSLMIPVTPKKINRLSKRTSMPGLNL
jgi:hypothetical protein